jgi:predicted nucleic acid-binding protein
VDLVFLDANVLFSAAYRSHSGLGRLWGLKGVVLLSSAYAVEEVRRNLSDPAQVNRLAELQRTLEVVPELPEAEYEPVGLLESGLPAKDMPILGAAIGAHATHLLTGDVTHFGHLFGRTIGRVRILTPARYLQGRLGGSRGPG